MGGFGAIAAAVLLLAGSSTGDKGVRDTLWGLGFVALAFATALLMRSAAQTLRRLPIRDKPTVPD
jgi:steroid 5-alpha reductase family enzyme